MIEVDPAVALAMRLRELRTRAWPDVTVTQRQVAEALGTSVPTVSAWEKERSAAQPNDERLQAYARFFASPRSVGSGPARLLGDDELTQDEERRRQELLAELLVLRERAAGSTGETSRPERGSLGGRFFFYPDDRPVRIIAGQMPRHEVAGVQYAHPWHPNVIQALWNADVDATLEAYAHIRAENPLADVRWVTTGGMDARHLTGDVVLLGGGISGHANPDSPAGRDEVMNSVPETLDYFRRRLELPARMRVPAGADPEYDAEFVVSLDGAGRPAYGAADEKVFGSRWLTTPDGERRYRDERGVEVFRTVDGFVDRQGRTSWTDEDGRDHPLVVQPQLDYDVAMIVRQPNPLNAAATVTVCTGLFSRGTLGAVKAFTDPQLRAGNEQWVREHLDPDRFWVLTYVPILPTGRGAQTVTPDLARDFHRLAQSA